VLCVGGVCVDHVLELETLPSGEGKQSARRSRWGGGGVAATAAVAIGRMGSRATWCGLLGDDVAGTLLVDMFRDAGVEVQPGSVVPGAATAIASVLVDAEGHRWLGFYRGEGLDDYRARLRIPDLTSIEAIMADYAYPELVAEAFQRGRERGIPRVLDLEQGQRHGVTEIAQLADHVIFSASGLANYTGIADPETGLQLARRRIGAAVVAVTLGPQGSVWLTETGLSWVSAPKIHAKDTTGCGDVFHGVYALAVAEGLPVREAATFATAAAAIKAERGEAWSGMPSRADTSALIEKGWT
jgi:sulfofructose kinase